MRLVSGCVSCLEHDEHYILTFPNGYGRSVLPHSWFCLCHHQMTRLIACLSLTLSSSVQVDSDRAVGGARRGVQHLLLQVGLQREHRVPHQTLLRREEAQDHRWDFVRGRWWHSLYHSSEAEFGFGWKMWVSSCVFLFQFTKRQKVFLLHWRRMERSDVCQVGNWSEFLHFIFSFLPVRGGG